MFQHLLVPRSFAAFLSDSTADQNIVGFGDQDGCEKSPIQSPHAFWPLAISRLKKFCGTTVFSPQDLDYGITEALRDS